MKKVNKRMTEHQRILKKATDERYITKKLERNIFLSQDKKFRNEFSKLTRILFDDILSKECAVCFIKEDLHIHHIQYVYPIVLKDLVRLCRACHIYEHQRLSPLFPVETI